MSDAHPEDPAFLTHTQIHRACLLYAAGATPDVFAETFKTELEPHDIVLLWHAAKTHLTLNQRHPYRETP